MKQPFYNDQAYIAESFLMVDEFITQSSRLASFKISSYKLSMCKSVFKETKDELEENLKASLFNYTDPCIILADTAFFSAENEN